LKVSCPRSATGLAAWSALARAVVGEHRDRIQAWEELCAKLGKELPDVTAAWLLHRPGVTAPIIGPRTLEQLDTAQRALEIPLDADVLARLDEIFPGYRTAPEHYAW
jgi:aryl-alcohol dehydrogenase-like predicted oxidoreductase